MKLVTPSYTWDWDYQKIIQQHLDRLTKGEGMKKLMLSVPPRHGKSELVTVRYAAWRLERNPSTRIVIAAYGQTLAEKFSRKVRSIVKSRIGLSNERTAANDWETVEGGGVRAVGLGAGVTGQGFDLLIIDDPVKSREEAESETYRERAWEWYTDDLYTRMEPGAALILIQTRWHEDDLAGRILASEQAGDWTVINLPAISDTGDALCPDRYDLSALNNIRATLGEYSFSALYQGNPVPREGLYFKVSQLEIIDEPPAGLKPIRRWDIASTTDGDYTAGVKMAKDKDGIYYVLDVVSGQWLPDDRNKVMLQTTHLDGRECQIVVPQDPGAAGVDMAKAFIRLFAGFNVQAERETGSKELRADPYAAQVNAGNVKLIKGSWNKAYIDELRSFPNGKYDDQVDGSSGAFNRLAKPRDVSIGINLWQ